VETDTIYKAPTKVNLNNLLERIFVNFACSKINTKCSITMALPLFQRLLKNGEAKETRRQKSPPPQIVSPPHTIH
jgi:hypothetical protein